MHVIFEAVPIGWPYGPEPALSHSLRPAGPEEDETNTPSSLSSFSWGILGPGPGCDEHHPAFPSKFSACGGELGAPRRDGAQAGSCSPLVLPEEGGGREQKANALSILPVQRGALGAHWGSVRGCCLPACTEGQAALGQRDLGHSLSGGTTCVFGGV